MLKISRDQHSNIVQAGQGRKQRDLLGSIYRLNSHSFLHRRKNLDRNRKTDGNDIRITREVSISKILGEAYT